VGNLLVHRALAVLELALDRERLVGRLADDEHVDAAILADDRLADVDLAVDLQPARPESLRHVAGDKVGVFAAGHVSDPIILWFASKEEVVATTTLRSRSVGRDNGAAGRNSRKTFQKTGLIGGRQIVGRVAGAVLFQSIRRDTH